ncbi:hypothetical protein [Desulfosarcina sp.]|uniref:hypothetical protein n=1 Tax=Desulfosarcina sp. TaxID=2027861 RepID=UPI0039710D54
MKKLLVVSLALLITGAFTVPAVAVDHEFGGYWRTRFFDNSDFSGQDDGSQDVRKADTRTRIHYTAVLSDELKLVNKFEMDATWGDTVRGDIGADGQNFEVKHSYADFNLGEWNVKMGTQGKTFARGFLFDDDFTGLIVRYVGYDMVIPFIWMKAYEGGYGDDANDNDFDYYGLDPTFSMGDLKLNPFVMYMTSEDASAWSATNANEAADVFFVGLNGDWSTDMLSVWVTGIYETGKVEMVGGDELDVAAYLFAAGASVNLDAMSVHGQFFYASGDDDENDDEANDYYVPKGRSYYWAEIMGYGVFDDQVSAGSPGDQISNIMAANVGVEFPLDKLTLGADVWYAQLVEDNLDGDTDLGTEIDITVKYQLLDDLEVTAVAAYLMAGDATGGGDEDPMELGVQFALKF